MPRPSKRAKLVDDASDSGEECPAATNGFKINKEFAQRFEHNKKREEKQRLEEKYADYDKKSKKPGSKRSREEEEEDESSTDESEDDEAEVITPELEEEWQSTLKALQSKDPRIYDKDAKFYREFDPDAVGTVPATGGKKEKEKPMYLQDYHRKNLLAGQVESFYGDDEADEDDAPPRTYQEEQDAARRELVGNMHALAAQPTEASDEDDEDDFMVRKSEPQHDTLPTPAIATTKPKTKRITNAEIAEADEDPETFLSNFMAAQAWRSTTDHSAAYKGLESDDSEDEARADAFESAFNLRFEDPEKANETLRSFARDVGKYGVRREETNSRKKAREREKERKEAEKREREEERARLRRLKIEEAEEKVARIREAAGLRGKDVDLEQWRDIIEGDFSDNEWDEVMKKRFGDKYYDENEGGDGEGSDEDVEMADAGASKKSKPKKPKWDDDIDIKDLVPEFEDEDGKPEFALSDDDDEVQADGGAPLLAPEDEASNSEAESAPKKKKQKTKKDRQTEKQEAKRAARKQRAAIEEIVDSTLPLSHPSLATSSSSKAPVAGFRYRETSPTNYGLTARDILFADDAQLNQYAGLKKMHAFREDEKKKRDKKKFSKKQRLRQWRKETFGVDQEPTGGFERVLGGAGGAIEASASVEKAIDGGVDVKDGERKKKRKRSGKGKKAAAGDVEA